MTKFQTIKRFASKTEGMNFVEVFENADCKQVDVVTSKYSVRITAYKGLNILGVAVYVANDLVFKRSADSQKEAVQFIKEHVDRIASEHIEQVANVSDNLTGEDMLYRALHQFGAFEITVEQCLSLIYKALDNAQTKEEHDKIKEYVIMFSERIASGYYEDEDMTANADHDNVANVSTDLTGWAYETSDKESECKAELYYEKSISFEPLKKELERLYNEYIQSINKGCIRLCESL